MATKDRVSDVRPYVERAIQDEDLRDNLKAAFLAARDVYSDLTGDRGVSGLATRVATDRGSDVRAGRRRRHAGRRGRAARPGRAPRARSCRPR